MTNGLVVMTPSSVAKTGGSSTATINADGSVTFGSCATLSLNGVFTSDYDNYMIGMRFSSSAGTGIRYRLRLAGVDNSTVNSYVGQTLSAYNTTISSGRYTFDNGLLGASSNAQKNGVTVYVFGPNLVQPTATRTVAVDSENGARFFDYATTHNQSTSYDGITLYPVSGDMTGLITVFGFNQ
jgi:hypothetical protein